MYLSLELFAQPVVLPVLTYRVKGGALARGGGWVGGGWLGVGVGWGDGGICGCNLKLAIFTIMSRLKILNFHMMNATRPFW